MPRNRGSWRGLETGTHSETRWPENADMALDQVPIPYDPIVTDLLNYEGGSASVLPWFDAKEDPRAETGLYSSPDPHYPDQDVGGRGIVGAYEPNVRTLGPVRQWGHEVSGGLTGDQELGRIMRFPANIPARYDPYNVYVTTEDYRDQLSAAVFNNERPPPSDEEITAMLLDPFGGR